MVLIEVVGTFSIAVESSRNNRVSSVSPRLLDTKKPQGFPAALGVLILEVVLVDDFEGLFVKFIDERFARGDFDRDDLVGGEVLKHHDDGAERVAMGSDEDFLAGLDLRGDLLIPVRFDALSGIDEALGERAILDGHFTGLDEVLVFLLVAGPTLIFLGEG